MWTNLQPFVEHELTGRSIETFARFSLYRAINIRRLVVMAGSGVSRAYGLPSWEILNIFFFNITRQHFNESIETANYKPSRKVSNLVQQINSLCGEKNDQNGSIPAFKELRLTSDRALEIKDNVLMDLCEALLSNLPNDEKLGKSRLWLARRDFAAQFRASEASLALGHLCTAFPALEKSSSHSTKKNKAKESSFLSTGDDEIGGVKETLLFRSLRKILVESKCSKAVIQELSKSTSPSKNGFGPNLDSQVSPDPVKTIIEMFNVSRIVTLNYDVQFERHLLQLMEAEQDNNSHAFRSLCSEVTTERPDPKTVAIESGVRRGAISTTLTAENIGDIVNFSAYSRKYEAQIFHLHGRLDDPENLVLTQKDYQRVYLRDGDAKRRFEEAQEVLFAGNDILFIGIGMNEEDVLRPFRRFASRNTDPDQLPRRIFALIPSKYGKNWREKNDNIAIKHAVHYNTYTIFYGNKSFRKQQKYLDKILNELLTIQTRIGKSGTAPKSVRLKHLEGYISKIAPYNEENTIRKIEIDTLIQVTKINRITHDFIAATILLINEIKSRVTSRGLEQELNNLINGNGKWWDEWRRPPGERTARYHSAGKNIAGEPDYLFVRHCPDYNRNIQKITWEILIQAGSIARENANFDAEHGRRILRLCLPRGGGKGSLVSLLLEKRHQENLFPPLSYKLSHNCSINSYSAAFVAHLSFSMEFSSVIKALTRFFSKRIATLQADNTGTYKRHNKIAKHTILRGSRKKFIQDRENEPRLAMHPELADLTDLETAAERPHRLDILNDITQYYAETAQSVERVFICLSGLEHLCDAEGDAHSAMHRAFFRLLTGTAPTGTKDDLQPPIDLVLITGRPDVPICYLSEEIRKKKFKKFSISQIQNYSTLSKTGRILVKWPQLEPIGWIERIYLTPIATEISQQSVGEGKICRNKDWQPDSDNTKFAGEPVNPDKLLNERVVEFLTWALQIDSTSPSDTYYKTLTPKLSLHRLLWNNVALTGWIVTLWARPYVLPKTLTLVNFLSELDRACSKDQFNGVVEKVLQYYREVDTQERTRHKKSKNSKPDEHLLNIIVDPLIMDIILRHLTLFALPIEVWVLMGCPLIQARLKLHYDERLKSLELEDKKSASACEKERIRLRVRYWMLRCLRVHLCELEKRGLVIPIFPAVNKDNTVDDKEDFNNAEFLHRRFSIHSLLREHLAFKMQLSLPDEGDKNHHQMSIYCDQPTDLPTPSPDHYALVSSILNYNIDQCNDSLWSAYFFNSEIPNQGDEYLQQGLKKTEILNQEKYAAKAVARRLFSPGKEAADKSDQLFGFDNKAFHSASLAGSYGQVHAVSQRLRGCYSLLRGAFSIGSISRLDDIPSIDNDNDTPFEAYRGWLRSIMNASIGVERNRKVINKVLDDQYFSDPMEEEKDNNLEKFQKIVREASVTLGLYERQAATKKFHEIRNPLYRDEIAWLYNERGLTSLIQGQILDALPLFQCARQIVSHRKTPKTDSWAFHAAERRIQLNYSVALIERGRLDEARSILEELERSSAHVQHSTPSQTRYFASAYLALCDHLSGSLTRAVQGYELSISQFVARKQLRAVAIFNRHLTDLHLMRDDVEQAKASVALSVNAASQAEQRDVQHLALLSQASVLIRENRLKAAQGRIERTLKYAKRLGLYRLQADALLLQSRVLLARGDYGMAGSAAAQGIAICVRNGLRLRKLSGLVLYGQIQLGRDNNNLAINILKEAKAEAESLGYQTQSARAADLLAGGTIELEDV